LTDIGEADSGSARSLSGGEELRISLRENPTTGYRWQVTQSGTGELRLIEDRFDAGSTIPSAVGAAGTRVLRFVAQKPGEVQIELVNRRPWEATASPSKTVRYTIHVR